MRGLVFEIEVWRTSRASKMTDNRAFSWQRAMEIFRKLLNKQSRRDILAGAIASGCTCNEQCWRKWKPIWVTRRDANLSLPLDQYRYSSFAHIVYKPSRLSLRSHHSHYLPQFAFPGAHTLVEASPLIYSTASSTLIITDHLEAPSRRYHND
jgi:hypothetical protein